MAAKRRKKVITGRPCKYDWEKLMSQKRFTFQRGKHFTCQVPSIAQQIWSAARRYGKVARIDCTDGNTLKVKVSNVS